MCTVGSCSDNSLLQLWVPWLTLNILTLSSTAVIQQEILLPTVANKTRQLHDMLTYTCNGRYYTEQSFGHSNGGRCLMSMT